MKCSQNAQFVCLFVFFFSILHLSVRPWSDDQIHIFTILISVLTLRINYIWMVESNNRLNAYFNFQLIIPSFLGDCS